MNMNAPTFELTQARNTQNNETGRVNAVWPGSSLHYIEMIRDVRWEDYEIEYLANSPADPAHGGNMWAFMGMGTCRPLVDHLDVSPYLTVENIDPDWMAALGIDGGKAVEAKLERVKAESGGVTDEKGSALETRGGAGTAGPRDIGGDGKPSVGDGAELGDHV